MNPSLNRNPLIVLEGETAVGRHHWCHTDRVGPNSNPAPGIQETAEAPGASDEAGGLPKVIESTLACLILALLVSFPARAVEPTPLSLNRTGPDLKLSWPATQPQPTGSVRRPYFELQRSSDLTRWQPFGERQRATLAAPGDLLSVIDHNSAAAGFFRLLTLEPNTVARLGSGGAEVFGYGAAFDDELKQIGQISPDEFAAKFPNPATYLPKLTWDPTTAQFWGEFNADIDAVNKGKEQGHGGYRSFDTRLNPPELAVFKTNGFVVSERLGSPSFGRTFYDLWHNDLPVFISTDALLQAWHRTYDAMLQEVEETYLFNSVGTLLDGMAAQVATADATAGPGVLHDSLRDADWFLAVARSLLAGTNQPPAASVLGQNARVAATLADIHEEQLKPVDDFMGFCRMVDFSQFKIRGHYTRSERLSRYFQCVMWLGRIDIPVAGGPFERCSGDLRQASPRELGTAIVFWHLLRQSGKFQTWADMEKVITAFVGWTDSLNFGQLNGLLAGAGIRTLADVPDVATLKRLQADLVRGELGVQNIRSDWFSQPLSGPERSGLPQAFTVFGQKFVPDSWAFSQTVFSSILWAENGVTNKVQRRVPGALDVAFATLGNDQVVPELVAQMKGTFADTNRPHALRFRDGKPYQHNLAATRAVMDSQTSESWGGNIYLSWLDTLRQLSSPTTTVNYPEAMRTRSWAMKTLNTQLASWTQLRHDTILYAKQPYSSSLGCVYPTGYVEPRIEFWRQLQTMAGRAADLIEGLNYEGTYSFYTNGPPQFDPDIGELIEVDPVTVVSLASIQNRQVVHLRSFVAIAQRLESLAEKELAQQCFTPEDLRFIDGLMETASSMSIGCASFAAYNGWYPQLFYRAIYWPDDAKFRYSYGCEAFDGLVADVHTDVPCSDCGGDPGSVLHQAVGRVNLLLLAVDSGGERFLCAGPVLSHYEVEVTGPPRRLSDEEWRSIADFQRFPDDAGPRRFEGLAPPPWTRSYLVPRPPE